jgi:hypothetical protein
MERGCYACIYVSDTRCHGAEGAICKFALGKLAGPRRVPDAGK